MNRVYKYTLGRPSPEPISVCMPSSAHPLHFGKQEGSEDYLLWADVEDQDTFMINHTFWFVGTGWERPDDPMFYVGTTFEGPCVWHLFKAPD